MTGEENVIVSPRTAAHIESFWRALDLVARERKYLTLLEAPSLPETREFALNTMANGDPQVVALVGDEVVGWCDIRRHYFPAHRHRGTLGMGIIPAYRGRGLGRRLIEAALQQAFSAGFVRIELDVHADNAHAIALYENVGFVREGIIRDAFFADGVYRDAIPMALTRRENLTSASAAR